MPIIPSRHLTSLLLNPDPNPNPTPTQVLEQLHSKLEAVELQIATADSEAKEKRAAKLREGHAELVTRIDTVSGLKPAHRAAKFEKEMVAARKQLLELDKLEVLQLLTMATRTMAMLAIATLSMAELGKLGAL